MSGEALTFVEIDIPVCSLTYGVLPCTASLVSSPPTGTDKCFNSLATCQDTENIDLQTVTWRFAAPATYLPRDIDIVSPSVISVDFSPAVVSLGENLGQRASLKVTLRDHPHSDAGAGFDKYYAERSYNPFEQGTLWGKFRARQPFLRGAALRWINGFVGDDIANMETRHFFIESFDGVKTDGTFTINAKDTLKFLDGDRAQAPVLSNGFLVSPIDDNDLSATLSPAGIGNSEYPASGHVNIGGNEVCSFTRSGDVLTIVRAQHGTTASAHAAQDRVQLCIVYDAIDPASIINHLITTYTDTPEGYVPLAEWQTETNNNLNRLYSAVITEPTAVNKLVSELVQQGPLAIWDDNVAQQLRLQVLRGIPTSAELFDEPHVIANTFAVSDQPEKRVSQVWVYFGQIDPTKRVDDPDNYRSVSRSIDEDAEANFGAAAIYKIFARWIPQLGSTIADTLGTKVLSRYTTAPRKFSFEVFRHTSQIAPVLGGGYRFEWWNLQEPNGAGENVPIQVTRLLPTPASWKVDAEEMLFSAPADDLTNRQIVIDSNINDVNLKDVHDSLFPELEIGQTVTCTVAAGVIVGSTNVSIPAFDVGTWDGSPTLNVIVIGRIQGKGGNGATAPAAGQSGGVALFTTEAINLTDTDGEIWGGGGGGGAVTGGGGGGGAGQLPGSGGGGAFPGNAGTTEAGGAGGVAFLTAGTGGGPGLAGQAATSAGGSPGLAIDGISNVTTIGVAGDRRGGTAN